MKEKLKVKVEKSKRVERQNQYSAKGQKKKEYKNMKRKETINIYLKLRTEEKRRKKGSEKERIVEKIKYIFSHCFDHFYLLLDKVKYFFMFI